MVQQQPLKMPVILSEYAKLHQNSTNTRIQYFSIPILSLGLLGVIWSIPFPHLNFLGKYNGFVNWASLVIAIAIYYYHTLSPVIAFAMIWVVFVFSAAIVGLEKMQSSQNWPAMDSVCLALVVVSLIFQFIGYKKEGMFPRFATGIQFLITGPFWLMHQIFKKIGVIK